MVIAPDQIASPTIKALKGEIVGAPDPMILRIVATVDAMATRGPADALIAPLRQRLSILRPPRPLRFVRLLFNPLNALIVPAQRWRPGEDSIPRSVLGVMADHVRCSMRDEAQLIEREIAGRTDADTDLVTRWGRSLWPAAAAIFRTDAAPETWATSGLGVALYRQLADWIAALLDQAPSLDAICAETANGLLPVSPEAVGAMLDRVTAADQAALPMMIALLLVRLPQATATMLTMTVGAKSAPMKAAMDQAVDRVLRQMNLEGGTEDLIGGGSLADAGVAASHIKTLLTQLDSASNKPQRREQLRTIRQRLDASCKARFTAGLEAELLAPLRSLGNAPDRVAIDGLEAAARSLRILELEARGVGSGATYDLLLSRATDMIKGGALAGGLAVVEQMRLVEFLAGPEAALAMLSPSP
jgi:hypothetical protein